MLKPIIPTPLNHQQEGGFLMDSTAVQVVPLIKTRVKVIVSSKEKP